jgi:dihydrolipoamide dehydrogenase
MPDFDVVVIGAGPGGYTAAIRAAQLGLKTAVIEKDAVGGLCLNWGCIPSKALLSAADLLNAARRGAEFGITFDGLSADLGVAVKRSRDIVARFVGGVETLLSQNKVEIIRGTGRLTGPTSLRVEPDGRQIEASNIILATGASTRSLPNVPPDGDRILTSREALALREVPKSIVIVGGGAIGCEFGYLYRSYGAEVTILELLPRLLPLEDEDVGRQLERSFATQGINVITGVSVESVAARPDGVTVGYTRAHALVQLEAEKALIGVGFSADTSSLGLESAGVETSRGWIGVDDYCQTNVPSVWAIGDVTGRLLLAHVASHQGITAVEKIAGLEPQPIDYDKMPRAVYCQPQVASLGLTEAQARERGYDFKTGRFPFRASGKAMTDGDTEGFVKLIVDRATNAILGFHFIGHNVTELIGEASLGAVLETTPVELGYTVHAHPTLSEALKEAALAVTGESIHFFTPKRT